MVVGSADGPGLVVQSGAVIYARARPRDGHIKLAAGSPLQPRAVAQEPLHSRGRPDQHALDVHPLGHGDVLERQIDPSGRARAVPQALLAFRRAIELSYRLFELAWAWHRLAATQHKLATHYRTWWKPARALLLESHPDTVGRIRLLPQNHKHISSGCSVMPTHARESLLGRGERRQHVPRKHPHCAQRESLASQADPPRIRQGPGFDGCATSSPPARSRVRPCIPRERGRPLFVLRCSSPSETGSP